MSSTRKKIVEIGFCFFIALITGSCEQTLTDTDFPYEEVLVIRGELRAGDTLRLLYVGRTLPYEENLDYHWDPDSGKYIYPESQGWVKDAVVTVSTENKVFVMTYTQRGFYKNDSLLIEEGKTYRLHIEWKGKTADAVTTVPEDPMLDSVYATSKTIVVEDEIIGYSYSYEVYSYECFYRAKQNAVLSLSAAFEETYTYQSMNGRDTIRIVTGSNHNVIKRTQSDNSVVDVVRNEIISNFSSGNSTLINKKGIFTLISYDEAFNKYYETYYSGDNDFSIEPRPVAWNVGGDAIGMFIGASKTVQKEFLMPMSP